MSPDPRDIHWVDGTLRSGDPLESAHDRASKPSQGCFTTARVEGGQVRFRKRHIDRLIRDANTLGIGDVRAATIESAFNELSAAAFLDGNGIIRVQISDDRDGLHVIAVPRAIGPEPANWSAIGVEMGAVAALPNGVKTTDRRALDAAWRRVIDAGADEAILRDSGGYLIEGTRTNLIVARSDGTLATPPLGSGAVAGIARALCLERVPALTETPIHHAELATAAELIATNAVRGARSITHVDEKAIGTGQPGEWSDRLAEALRRD